MNKETWKVRNDDDAEWIIKVTNDELLEVREYKERIQKQLDQLNNKLKSADIEIEQIEENRNSFLFEYFGNIPDKLKKEN